MEFFKDNAVVTYIDAGTIKYEVEAFYMKKLDGDEKLEYLHNKILKGEVLTEEDILTLSFIPLMSGKGSRSERTLKSIDLADQLPEGTEKLQCISLLYALLEKFGDKFSKERFKEVISVTEIGKMILEEGIKKGIEEGEKIGESKGEKKGKAEILIKQLIKKFKSLPDGYKEKIRNLPEETIEVIATDIFDIEKVEELEKYFG